MTVQMSTPTPLQFALGCSFAGLPVFPCGLTKAPITGHGHKDATTAPGQIRQWFADKSWDEVMVATPAGLRFSVIDCDGEAAVTEFLRRTPEADGWPSIDTPHGRHYYVQASYTSRSIRAVELPDGQGIDVLGNGYVIIGSRSRGNFLPVLNDLNDLPVLPCWLAERIARPVQPIDTPIHANAEKAWIPEAGERRLRSSLDAIRLAPSGQRHDALWKRSLLLGGLIASSAIARPAEEVIDMLSTASVQSGHDAVDAVRTATDGVTAGLGMPVHSKKQGVGTGEARTANKNKKEISMSNEETTETVEIPDARWKKLDTGWALDVPAGSVDAGDTVAMSKKDGTVSLITIAHISKEWDSERGERMFAYPERPPRHTPGEQSVTPVQQQEKTPPPPSDLRWRKLEKGWVVEAPAGQLSPGDVVSVARKDGSTAEVTVHSVSKAFDHDGEAHVFAYPAHHPPKATEQPVATPSPALEVERS